MASLTFSDNRNGTGGVFQITGSSGSNNTLWVSQFHGSNSARTFAAVASRTSDGPVSWPGGNGCYMAHVASLWGTQLSLSSPIVFRITNGSLSLYEQVLIAVREHVLSLALPLVTNDPSKHVICKMGAKLQELMRQSSDCVYYIPTAESFSGSDNAYVSVALPVNVIFYTRTGSSLREGLSELLIAREDANLSFAASPLADLPQIHSVECKPGVVTDPGQWAIGYDVSVLQFIAYSEQIDGIL